MTEPIVRLDHRVLISVTGPDAADYLDRMLTQSVAAAATGVAAHGALLTPQGKILSDCLIVRSGDGFLLDCPEAGGPDLMKRLTLFRLRAKVEIADATAAAAVLLLAGDGPVPDGWTAHVDGRHPGLGARAYVERTAAAAIPAGDDLWARRRVALAIPELGQDAPAGDAFPHDLAMDELAGVSFTKGCFVGQEVVSRMKHRGTARRRPLRLTADAALPPAGTPIEADGRVLGSLGTVADGEAIAILRLDKVRDARDAGVAITAGGVGLAASLPAWAAYGWPSGGADD